MRHRPHILVARSGPAVEKWAPIQFEEASVRKVAVLGLLFFAAQVAVGDVAVTEKSAVRRNLRIAAQQKAKKKKASSSGGVHASALHIASNGRQPLTDAAGLEYFIETDTTTSTNPFFVNASGAASDATYTTVVPVTTVNGGTTTGTTTTTSTSDGGTTTTTTTLFLNDAFDGYGALCVSFDGGLGPCMQASPPLQSTAKGKIRALEGPVVTYDFYGNDGAPTTDCNGRQLVFNTEVMGPLSVFRKVFVPTNDEFIRWLNYFTNTTGAPVTVNVITRNNLGSDQNTIVVSSSNGNNLAEMTDTWITTFQNYNQSGRSSDPRLGHIIQGPGNTPGGNAPVTNIMFADGDDNPFWTYTMTLAPGQTRIIMTFATGQPSKADAATQSDAIVKLPPSTKQCISNAELGQISNWVAAVVVNTVNLSITKNASSNTVNAGAPFSYTINVANSGPGTAANVSVTDTLPAGVTFTGATGTGWTCNNAAGTVTCTMASLPVGAANPITINVTAPLSGAPLVNTASVTTTDTDTNPANNTSAPVTVTVNTAGIPLLDPRLLAALAIALAAIAVWTVRASS